MTREAIAARAGCAALLVASYAARSRRLSHSLIFYWQGECNSKDAFQRWRAAAAEKKRARAAVKCAWHARESA